MEMSQYLELSARTCAELPDGLHLDQRQVDLLHAAMGMCTEAAEMLDAMKKHIFYGKPLDEVNCKEEPGDALWYVALWLRKWNTTFEEVAGINIDKLAARYKDKFSKDRAINRDTEREGLVMRQAMAADNPGQLPLFSEGVLDKVPVTKEEDEFAGTFSVPLDSLVGGVIGASDVYHWAEVSANDMLSPAQESKYGGWLFKRASGETLPKDEPLFILRAQDRNAANTLRYYASTVREPGHKQCVLRRVQDFLAFADANPSRMKEPDTLTVAEV